MNIEQIIEEFQNALRTDCPLEDSLLRGVYPDGDLANNIYAYYLLSEALDFEERGRPEAAALHRRYFDQFFKAGIMPMIPPEA